MNDRSRLIRLASTLPVGSPQRRAILADIAAPDTVRSKRAGVLEDSVLSALKGGGVTGTPAIKSFRVTDEGIVARVEVDVVLPSTPTVTREALPSLSPAQAIGIVQALPPSELAEVIQDIPPLVLGSVPFASFPAPVFKKMVQGIVRSGLSNYSDEILISLLEGRRIKYSRSSAPSDFDDFFKPIVTSQLAPESMVSGFQGYVTDFGLFSITVRNGALTSEAIFSLEWFPGRGRTLKVHVPIKDASVSLSKRVYPTRESVHSAFGADLQELDVDSLTQGNEWIAFMSTLKKGARGVLGVSFSQSHPVSISMTQLPRNLLEILVKWAAEP